MNARAFVLQLLASSAALGQSVVTQIDPAEPPGLRPYEMVWANRAEPAPPTVRFDQLQGWRMEVDGGAEAKLEVTRAQNVWDRPVARLRYRGGAKSDSKPRILITPPQPIDLPPGADSIDMWVYGNRWDWENPPGTPPVHISLSLRDGASVLHKIEVDHVRWQEWWLMHKRLPKIEPLSLRFEGLEITGGSQADWREIFLDSIRAYHEELNPISFAARPRRNLTLFPEQSAGANTGAGTLPFPTREETILPMQLLGPFTVQVREVGDVFEFQYEGADGRLLYRLDPKAGLGGITGAFSPPGKGAEFIKPLDGAAVLSTDAPSAATLHDTKLEGSVLTATYNDGTTLRFQLWQKSLVCDVINTTGRAKELQCGQVAGVTRPRTVWLPYLTYGGGAHPCVLLSGNDANPLFTSIWLDWYRSNGSEFYAAESASTNSARINGGVRYHPRTDGQRNLMFERVFVTLSPRFEEVLPTVPNPVGLHAADAVDRLWQESWGPDNFEQQMKRSRMLRAYGIEKLIQCNHEIAWRDGGESFTLRRRAAPKKGGDDALKQYVTHQRSLGWMAGLYSNYTDYAPVNEFWSPDGVQRQSDGAWRSAWPRCYAEKPLKAVEFDAMLAPQIKAKFQPNSAYTDVHTAVAPWGYNDYDARVPGAGTFAQTFYAYGELLRNDSRVYGGPIFSEGLYHWLYAGLADGNYALAYDGRPLAKEPLLPAFDLYQIHSKECDIGMGWTANFCDAIPEWKKPENIDRAIDRFLLHTLAYGHIGWLVEEEHGIDRSCRSYYMLQQVQARYGLKVPQRIAYWNGSNLVDLTEAVVQDLPRTRRQLHVEYPGGLRLWLNDHPSDPWTPPGTDRTLPPAGWIASTRDGELLSYSGLEGTNRVDYLRSGAYTYLDGRGRWFSAPEASSDGALSLKPLSQHSLEIFHISGSQPFTIRRPYGMPDRLAAIEAYDVEGQRLTPSPYHEQPGETRIELTEKAVRYVLRF